MNKFFDLGVILSFITGISCVDDFGECYKLVAYIYDNKYIATTTPQLFKEEIKEHLTTTYPQLKDVRYSICSGMGIDEWLNIQKSAYGEKLPVPKIGCVLVGKSRKRQQGK